MAIVRRIIEEGCEGKRIIIRSAPGMGFKPQIVSRTEITDGRKNEPASDKIRPESELRGTTEVSDLIRAALCRRRLEASVASVLFSYTRPRGYVVSQRDLLSVSHTIFVTLLKQLHGP